MNRKMIKIGEDYGYVRVTGLADKNYRYYVCECLKCGKTFECNGSTVFKYSETGCGECRKKLRIEERAEQCIGKCYGNIEILNLSDKKVSNPRAHRDLIASCLCHKCGSITDIRLSRLRAGKVKECKYCSRKNLQLGYDLTSEALKDGTNAFFLKNRKVNKNSQTGYTGVSLYASTGKYRASITFQKKQYHLGLFENIDDAISARKEAEKQIYGPFLDWYAKKYPETWAKIEKKSGSSL